MEFNQFIYCEYNYLIAVYFSPGSALMVSALDSGSGGTIRFYPYL